LTEIDIVENSYSAQNTFLKTNLLQNY